MKADARLAMLRRAIAGRRVAIALACATPILAALVAVAALRASALVAIIAALAAGAIAALLAWRAVRSTDPEWIARALDAALPAMEDSAALLLRGEQRLSALQRLQRARLGERLAALEPDLRPGWPWRQVGAALACAVALLAVGLLAPTGGSDVAREAAPAPATAPAAASRIVQAGLAIQPPAYTNLPARSESALDAKAPEGSVLHWRVRFDPQPVAASLQFHDGARLVLARVGDDWTGEWRLDASALYRIVLDGAPPPADDRLHRLDAVADRAPEVRVVRPERSLTLVEPGQRHWELEFEADDDYAITDAKLMLTLAQGGGENVTFKEQEFAPAAEPIDGARHLRYRHVLDLDALGVGAGDDVIVRLRAGDNREPQPNVTRSASFILRWPAEASTDSAALEGVVQHTLPAYFRSQRQIIIDTEALLAEQPRPQPAKFLARSDSLGVDQRVLRMRYGQFLGEESESVQVETAAREEATHGANEQESVGTHGEAHATAPAHDHAGSPAARFGDADGVVAEYGHVHDIAEAATLLDPETKETLRAALAEMWQSELHLRQGEPHLALPYEYRALDLIKRVQQSTRIYLARVGLELPAPDESRRLGGDREGLLDRVGTLAAVPVDATPLATLWHALDGGGEPGWDEAERWIAANPAQLPDPLGVLAAIDRARRDPTCVACRTQLRGVLWPALPVPAAAVAPRAAPDAAGRAYLDALPDAEATR